MKWQSYLSVCVFYNDRLNRVLMKSLCDVNYRKPKDDFQFSNEKGLQVWLDEQQGDYENKRHVKCDISTTNQLVNYYY